MKTIKLLFIDICKRSRHIKPNLSWSNGKKLKYVYKSPFQRFNSVESDESINRKTTSEVLETFASNSPHQPQPE